MKKARQVPLSPEHQQLLEQHAGEGVSFRGRDTRHIESEFDPNTEKWIAPWAGAFFDLEDGDPTQAIALLRSDEPLPSEFRFWVAYVLDKYHLRLRGEAARASAATDPWLAPWISVFFDLEDGDRKPAIALLNSDEVLPSEFRMWIANLFDRYELQLRRGKSKLTAPYEDTYDELRLREMVEEVDLYADKKNVSKEKARLKIAESRAGRKPTFAAVERLVDKLEVAMRDGRGSTRRMRKRRGR